MTTLMQHIDQLDNMVTNHASTPELRSQIAFIGREVSALQADFERLAEEHSALQNEHAKHNDAQSSKDLKIWKEMAMKANELNQPPEPNEPNT